MTCKQEFKIGDRVKVVRKVPSNDPDGMGIGCIWGDNWIDEMDEAIGMSGVVEWFCTRSRGIDIGLGYNFPSSSLKLIEEYPEKRYEKLEGTVNILTIESFLQQMPADSNPTVSTSLSFGNCKLTYSVYAYSEEFVTTTKERLQDIMKALLVLYKE
jgi:hypothetical protein